MQDGPAGLGSFIRVKKGKMTIKPLQIAHRHQAAAAAGNSRNFKRLPKRAKRSPRPKSKPLTIAHGGNSKAKSVVQVCTIGYRYIVPSAGVFFKNEKAKFAQQQD